MEIINPEKKDKSQFYFKNKAKNFSKDFRTGLWSIEEHRTFLDSIIINGTDWIKAEKKVKTRNSIQIRSHYQKFILKVKSELLKERQEDPNLNVDILLFNKCYSNIILCSSFQKEQTTNIKIDRLVSLIVNEFFEFIHKEKSRGNYSKHSEKCFFIEKDKIKLKKRLIFHFSKLFKDILLEKTIFPSNPSNDELFNNTFYNLLINDLNKVMPFSNLQFMSTNTCTFHFGEDTIVNNTFINSYDNYINRSLGYEFKEEESNINYNFTSSNNYNDEKIII